VHHDLIFFNLLRFLDHPDQVIELAVHGPPAAPAAGHINGPKFSIFGVAFKSAGPGVKGILA
jgi:hypothetical protein